MSFIYNRFDEQNFLKNTIKTFLVDGTEHCWLWQGSKNTNGYGYFSNSSNTEFAHRFSVQYHGRVIPEGFVIDHTCEIRCCVNPHHLAIVTQKQNLHNRGKIRALINTDCINFPKKKDKYDECIEELLNCTLLGMAYEQHKDSIDVLIDMIDIIKKDPTIFNLELEPNERIIGYKRRWFWEINEVLKYYGFTFAEITYPKPVQP